MINPETVSKDQTKKEFAKFVEDYNTGQFLIYVLIPTPHITQFSYAATREVLQHCFV